VGFDGLGGKGVLLIWDVGILRFQLLSINRRQKKNPALCGVLEYYL
jgi:hypothetical protein